MKFFSVQNNQSVSFENIPFYTYQRFLELNTGMVGGHAEMHCVNYFGFRDGRRIRLVCCIADDTNHVINLSASAVYPDEKLLSFTSRQVCFGNFERELHENFRLRYTDHPWLKPVRYAFDRADATRTIENYPFFTIDSEELHEVGVGPIHAGVIEPGHFRFICNGEQILHLEIQLGYQHRGVEYLFIVKDKLLQREILAESIAGDTVIGHSMAFAHAWEGLAGFERTQELELSRTIALELERIAIHTGDLSAICTDIAFQLGSAVFGRLRTPIINFLQEWCGNRLGKGLIRPGRNQYNLTPELAERLTEVLDKFEPDFVEMNKHLFQLPSALSRFERTGVLSTNDALAIGCVGMAARTSGLCRDLRLTHPYGMYPMLEHQPLIKHHGDVYSRVQLRREEVLQSIEHIRKMLAILPSDKPKNTRLKSPAPGMFSISLIEGWRGEICHCSVTGDSGELLVYKVKDPSFHNWMALALAVRNNEISDFPVCNKSFNLSYCGNDL